MRAPAPKMSRELQVGIFILTALLVVDAFSFKITDSPIFRRGNVYYVHLNDATGIFKNSKVKLAGIDVGVIHKIELEGMKARITIVIDEGIEIPANARFLPKPLGILGDKYIEILVPNEPEKSSQFNFNDRQKKKSFDFSQGKRKGLNFFLPMASAQQPSEPRTLNNNLRNQREILKPGSVVRGEDSAATLEDITRQLGDVSADLKAISKDIRQLISENKGKVGDSFDSVNQILRKIDQILKSFDDRKMRASIRRLSESVDNFGKTLENLEDISRKLNEGEGTIGRLINDSETVEQLNRSLMAVNSAFERARRTLVTVNLATEYFPRPENTKSSAGIEIATSEDNAYLVALVMDEAGTSETKIETVTVNGGSPSVTETRTQKTYQWRYSLQFAKRIAHSRFRLGIFESTGGLGFDHYFFNQKLKLSSEVFDFVRTNNRPHLKIWTSYNFWSHFCLSLGGHDLLAKKDLRGGPSFLLGLGISFTDQDLRSVFALRGLP